VLKTAVQKAKLGNRRTGAIKRLDEQARHLERHVRTIVEALVTEECARSHQYGGRSVFCAEPHPANSRSIHTGERARWGQRDDQQRRMGTSPRRSAFYQDEVGLELLMDHGGSQLWARSGDDCPDQRRDRRRLPEHRVPDLSIEVDMVTPLER